MLILQENSDYEPSELAELSSDSEGYDASSEEESEDFEDDQTDKSRGNQICTTCLYTKSSTCVQNPWRCHKTQVNH